MVLVEPGRLEERTFPVPDVADEGAVLDVEAASVCGTDIGMYRGKSDMGELPVVLGHEVAGRIVDGSDETLESWDVSVGDRVMPEPYLPCNNCRECYRGHYHMCSTNRLYGITLSVNTPPSIWGGYGEYMYLDPNTRVHRIGDHVSPRAACLGSVIGNGVRWIVRKGSVSPGDSVAIVGPGAQGLATTVVAAEAGADPIVLCGLETDTPNLGLGEELGATHTIYTDTDDPVSRALEPVNADGFDVVVVTAPAEPAVRLGIELVRPRGRLVQVGLGGSDPSIDLDRIVFEEITVFGGRGQAGDVGRAMELLERNADAIAQINSHTFPVPEAETAIERQIPGPEADPEIVHAAVVPEKNRS